MNISQPTLFDSTRPRFITVNNDDQFDEVVGMLKREGHFIPTLTRGKRNAQWIVEVIYKDEWK